ncbi:GPI transamidase subunit PIG-U, partial [Rozella allomycis CSF55]
SPNIGIFWYFFTEMFEHFRTFFLFAFQLCVFSYFIPSSIKFRQYPDFLVVLIAGIISIFKTYPSYHDTGFFLSFVALYYNTFPNLRRGFIALNLILFSMILGPTFWYLWIYHGGGNVNFFYSSTLMLSIGQIFLLSDMAFEILK